MLRYLKGSMDNEPDRTWNKDMHSLVQEMIHFRNGLQPSEEPDPCKVSEFEERYRKILETARKEYEDVPANDYYRDGYNLFLRMEKYMQNHLLLLHDLRVPATNNEAERLLRNYKCAPSPRPRGSSSPSWSLSLFPSSCRMPPFWSVC